MVSEDPVGANWARVVGHYVGFLDCAGVTSAAVKLTTKAELDQQAALDYHKRVDQVTDATMTIICRQTPCWRDVAVRGSDAACYGATIRRRWW
eukprot:3588589-Rhodomonas_salina.15